MGPVELPLDHIFLQVSDLPCELHEEDYIELLVRL